MEHFSTDTGRLQKEKLHTIWNLSIWNKLHQTMVRQCDLTWNPICDSILLMYKKLLDLGWIYQNGEIVISFNNHSETKPP